MLTRGLADPRLDGTMCTVTRVDVAEDLRNATLLVSVLPEKAQKRALAALQHAEPHIRRHIADVLRLGSPPLLSFDLDKSGKKQAALLEALAKVAREREQEPGKANPGQSGGETLAPDRSLGNPSEAPEDPQA